MDKGGVTNVRECIHHNIFSDLQAKARRWDQAVVQNLRARKTELGEKIAELKRQRRREQVWV